MWPGKLRVGLGARLWLDPLKVWLCLGLGLGLGRPRLGQRLTGLWSILSLELMLRLGPCLWLHLVSGLQVRLRLG